VLVLAAAAASSPEPPRGFDALPAAVGRESTELVAPDETLLDVAYRQRVGFELLERANPGVDRWIPTPGTIVRLPALSLPPRVEPKGLVLNLPEMRLYDFRSPSGPEVYHVAIGDGVDPTLIGTYRIGEKRIDPSWHVPESIRREKPELPAVVPPGPDNPLGDRWMSIGTTSYGIHGTNNPWSIGRQATHGCVRLYADEMRRLFDATPSGTPLQIVYQPYKWGRDGDAILLEAHPDPYARVARPLDDVLALARELGIADTVDPVRVTKVLLAARGTPERVGTRPPAPAAATSAPTS
jgi:L,D-transpeptidase ErfK/SrfK